MWADALGVLVASTMQLLALGALVMLSLSILRRI